MKAPSWWAPGVRSPLAGMLVPLGFLYGLGTLLRRVLRRSWKCPVPVICVGNLIAGGAGKTPVCMDLAQRLLGRNVPVQIITRGYGGQEDGPLKVSQKRYDARLVGDEALLLSTITGAWIAKDRKAGCRGAVVDGAGCIILDDGFQNPRVRKDVSLIVVDGGFGFGNGYMIPAGPLREPMRRGLARADAVILLGEDEVGITAKVGGICPIIRGMIEPVLDDDPLTGKDVIAFAGIGRPEKFFDTLRTLPCDLKDTVSFADHHHFSRSEIVALKEQAETSNCRLVTTAKDIVRIAPDLREGIDVLNIRIRWEDEAEINRILDRVSHYAT